MGKFGQKPLLRFPDGNNNNNPAASQFVRPDMTDSTTEDAPRTSVRATAGGNADFDMATLGDVQRKYTGKAPVRSALEQASQMSNDILWTDFGGDNTPTKQRRRK